MMLGLALILLGAFGWWFWESRNRRTHAVGPGYQPSIELPHEQAFELYHNAFSLCSKKLRVCMAELDLDYESHPIDLIETGSYETLSRHFLAVNPAGTVPVLVHNGHPVYESHEQIRYAADHAGEDSEALVPEEEQLRREMQIWVDLASLTGDDPLAAMAESAGNCVPGITLPLFASMLKEIPTHRILVGLLFHRLRFRPFLFLLMKAAGLGGLKRVKPLTQAIERSIHHMNRHLDDLEIQLEESKGPWILGEFFSLADISWVVVFDRMREADFTDVFLGEGRRERVAAYRDRLFARESYSRGIWNHEHPTVRRGTERLREAKANDPSLVALLGGSMAAGESSS
ncbi:MAG: glutathione S-transferase family protein [Myxococcota bacterium]|nr:glutathione S-transferase family protein [Myxococcota bacterium]